MSVMFLDVRLPARFWSKVAPCPMSGCWLWTAGLNNHGYAQFNPGENKPTRAYRYAYEQLVGKVPSGLELDHRCRVRCCVNPAHLEPVTHAENMRRGDGGKKDAIKTHCPKGHAYDDRNTRIIHRANGRRARRCRECAAIAVLKHRSKGAA